jgi:hypothetical protein
LKYTIANGVVDAADYTIWRDNLGRTTADLPPHAPFTVNAAATGATTIEVNWESVGSATHYSVLRRQPDTEVAYSTIAINVAANSYTDSTVATDTVYEYRLFAHNMNGSSPASQAASVTAGQSNLTAYRPQSIQGSFPVDAPIYTPFLKKAVLEQQETDNSLGPGIRINLDDDNSNGTADAFESGAEIPLENDLIEVRVDRLPGQGDLVLSVGGSLALYYNHDKETPIPLTGGTSGPLGFTNDTVTVFVEWKINSHGLDTLRLVDQSSSTTLDTIRFHSFKSLTVVFGGRGQNPVDTDGDGTIGDVTGAQDREGIFDVAQVLYDNGYDVMAFQSTTNVDVATAEAEIESGWDRRLLDPLNGGSGFAVIGHSWGGGLAHDLIEDRLYLDGYVPFFTVYLDAVHYGTHVPQEDWPEHTLYLLNIWQQNSFINGAAISNPEEIIPGVTTVRLTPERLSVTQTFSTSCVDPCVYTT